MTPAAGRHGAAPPPAAAALAGSMPGRADLIRALVLGGRPALAGAAEILGFEPRPPAAPSEAPREKPDARRAAGAALPAPGPTDLARHRPAPLPCWRPVFREYVDDGAPGAGERAADRPGVVPRDLRPDPHLPVPRPEPIVAWPRLWRALEDRLKSPIPRRAVDVEGLVRRWSRGELVRRLPRRSGLAHARLALLLDRSERLKPFWRDQVAVAGELARRLGRSALRFLPRGVLDDRAPPLAADERLLVLSDLGFYGGAETAERWARFGRELRRAGASPPVALVPCPQGRWQGEGPRLFAALDWSAPERSAGAPASSGAEVGGEQPAVDQVLRLASVARRLETGLVRQLRRLVPEADLGTEADLWLHPAVRAAQALGIVLDEEKARRLRLELVELPRDLQQRVVELLERWHAGVAPETWAAEVADLLALGVPEEIVGEAAVARSSELFEKIANRVAAGEGPLVADSEAWVERLSTWWSRGFLRHQRYRDGGLRAMAALQRRYPGRPPPVGVTPEMLARESGARPIRRYGVWHEGTHLRVRSSAEAPGAGSLVAEIDARHPRVLVDDGLRAPVDLDLRAPEPRWPAGAQEGPLVLVTDVEALELEGLERPSWARRSGRDRFGLWAAFDVAGVWQRLRWIPPGRFVMGSAETEVGRWDDEGPQREVRLTRGFWFGETPCTQALWEVVKGSNPSRFKSPARPVEQVSWEDCQKFLKQLGEEVPGLDFRLPTEAEWEYACRAGTVGATWVGDLDILGERNAPGLDALAWYGGNSGVEFELEDGWDTSDWKEKQYPQERAGTHPVAQKAQNPWGLYDMLGNVHEWCSDFWAESYEGAGIVDPSGPETGSSRVIRGGSWDSLARDVRAACRHRNAPRSRRDALGFRLARGPEGEAW